MSLTTAIVKRILTRHDVEGLIKIGAPSDEYDAEASDLVQHIMEAEAGGKKVSENEVVEMLFAIWQRQFELSPEELKLRSNNLRSVAKEVSRSCVKP